MITDDDLEFIKEYDWTMVKFINSMKRVCKYVNAVQCVNLREIRAYRPTISFEVIGG